MIIIEEVLVKQKSTFIKKIYDCNKNLLALDNISFSSYQTTFNNFEYLIIYDNNMNLLSSVFEFLNFECLNESINSRIKYTVALKYLFTFEKIINKNVCEFIKTDYDTFKLFLKGINLTGTTIFFNLKSSRSIDTVNDYLSIYRKYLSFLGKEDSYLFKVKSTKRFFPNTLDNSSYHHNTYFLSSEKKPSLPTKEVPKYISIDEFVKIIKVIEEEFNILDESIVRLMFECGLRIGEVLGITNDDLVEEEINHTSSYFIYIRNRLSDSKDQRAKGCLKVLDSSQYLLTDYQKENLGYHKISISKDLFDLLNNYIENSHTSAYLKKNENYKLAKADRVDTHFHYYEFNFYIFINFQGKKLTQQNWNKRLRKIFKKANLVIDKLHRSTNLNHRFRHGFAMFQIQYLKINELQLQKRMRHRSLSSTLIYFNPTLSDTIALKTSFSEELYSIIPTLKL